MKKAIPDLRACRSLRSAEKELKRLRTMPGKGVDTSQAIEDLERFIRWYKEKLKDP